MATATFSTDALAITEELVIRGDLVEHVERRVTARSSLGALLPFITTPPVITSPILPSNTRWFRWDQETQDITLMVELPPAIRTIRTCHMENPIRVMMPWQYFLFNAKSTNPNDTNWRLTDYFLLWSKHRFVSWESEVIPALLPNIYRADGRICFGSTAANSSLTLGNRINTIVNEFFSTTFNRDLGWNRPAAYRSFARWQAESRSNPMSWLDWPDFDGGRAMSRWTGLTPVRLAPDIRAEGFIPPTPPGMSFGRAAEWLHDLSDTERLRLRIAMNQLAPEYGWEPLPVVDYEEQDAEPATAQVAEPTPDEGVITGGTSDIVHNLNGDEEREQQEEADYFRGDDDNTPRCDCDCGCDNEGREDDNVCMSCDEGDHVDDRMARANGTIVIDTGPAATLTAAPVWP